MFPKLIGQMTHADAAHIAEVFGVFGTLFFVMQFFAAPAQRALFRPQSPSRTLERAARCWRRRSLPPGSVR